MCNGRGRKVFTLGTDTHAAILWTHSCDSLTCECSCCVREPRAVCQSWVANTHTHIRKSSGCTDDTTRLMLSTTQPFKKAKPSKDIVGRVAGLVLGMCVHMHICMCVSRLHLWTSAPHLHAFFAEDTDANMRAENLRCASLCPDDTLWVFAFQYQRMYSESPSRRRWRRLRWPESLCQGRPRG